MVGPAPEVRPDHESPGCNSGWTYRAKEATEGPDEHRYWVGTVQSMRWKVKLLDLLKPWTRTPYAQRRSSSSKTARET
ncbi:hypothetical protein N7488_003864 [Penicillium malachiteum]|nr:hypothetical protein N7488_003864 [Penicillium malachiteum]